MEFCYCIISGHSFLINDMILIQLSLNIFRKIIIEDFSLSYVVDGLGENGQYIPIVLIIPSTFAQG